jgi:AraC-like DNA-binding protein
MSKPTVCQQGCIRFVRTAIEGVVLSQMLRMCGQRRVWTPHARFALCTEGNVEVLYRGVRAVASPGVVAFIEAGETASATATAPASAWVLDVTASAIHRAVGRPVHLRAPYVVADSPVAQPLADLVLSITRGDSPLEQDGRFVAFVNGVATHHGERQDRATCPSAPVHVRRVRELLDDRFAETLTLDDLADCAGLNPLYLVRVFHGTFGMPPHEYQLNVRVHRACELLSMHRSASEVAVSVGFSDLSHLTRHFKRLVGVPPGEFARLVS